MATKNLISSSWLVGAFAVLLALTAQGEEPWKQLPATPSLPPHTIGQHVTVNGARIWYAQWGEKGHGVPVMLLHGGFANSDYFGNLIPALVKHGYWVIAMDSRGHGRSGRSAEPITYHLMASDVLGLMDSLKIDKIALVGWSDGGCIGYDIGINHPERLARLFTFGANADTSGLAQSDGESPIFHEYWSRVQAEYRRLSPTPDDFKSFSDDVLKMWRTLPAYTAAQLATIIAPTTIADGQYDDAIRLDHLKYLVATIPHAKLVILPNLGHIAMLQGPDAFNAAVLDFLQEGRAH